ncbi:MAG: FAD:protein FMN transferase, partial [Campylobacterales bacterium]|nr:FAD:protein FMN transferase [Campylobacterales bacterium]
MRKIAFLVIFSVSLLAGFNRTQLHMGTLITLQSSSNDAINQGFKIFKDLDNKLSTYKSTSEVSLYNKNSKSKLSKETLDLIKKSKEIKKLSNGYFNISFRGKNTLDFGGIAKGFAVDKIAKKWRSLNIEAGTISASGDIRCLDICNGYIEDPKNEGKLIFHFKGRKKDLSISTSGNKRRPGHLKDPKTNRSIYNFGSLTLFSFGDNTTLDGLTT